MIIASSAVVVGGAAKGSRECSSVEGSSVGMERTEAGKMSDRESGDEQAQALNRGDRRLLPRRRLPRKIRAFASDETPSAGNRNGAAGLSSGVVSPRPPPQQQRLLFLVILSWSSTGGKPFQMAGS